MESYSPVVLVSLVALGLVAGVVHAVAAPATAEAPKPAASFFDLEHKLLGGQTLDLASYRGKVVLVVNVASECGFTRQYAGLQKLHDELSATGRRRPRLPEQRVRRRRSRARPRRSRRSAETNFGVTFPILAKGVVKPGPEQSSLYTFLTAGGDVPSWNFCKYLVGKDGQVKGFFPSKVEPDDKALRERILAEVTK